jgi:hypothetical protein
MRRVAIGVSALMLLVGAGWLQWTSPEHDALSGVLARAGAVLAAVWLAYDALLRIPLMSLIGLPLLILVVVFSRTAKWLILIVPMVLLLALFWPRIQGKK